MLTDERINDFEELLGDYWELAYEEGRLQLSNGDKANAVLNKIRELWNQRATMNQDNERHSPEPLCEDEGCPHHGIDHVCISKTSPAMLTDERCGAWAIGGRCCLPKGHNRGRVDIPSNHQAEVLKTPEQGEAVTLQIDHDAEMNRYYIPVHPKWEIQTKGTGSTFRISKRDESGDRWLVLDEHLHPMLEEMARDINALYATPQPAECKRCEYNSTTLDLQIALIKKLQIKLADIERQRTEPVGWIVDTHDGLRFLSYSPIDLPKIIAGLEAKVAELKEGNNSFGLWKMRAEDRAATIEDQRIILLNLREDLTRAEAVLEKCKSSLNHVYQFTYGKSTELTKEALAAISEYQGGKS